MPDPCRAKKIDTRVCQTTYPNMVGDWVLETGGYEALSGLDSASVPSVSSGGKIHKHITHWRPGGGYGLRPPSGGGKAGLCRWHRDFGTTSCQLLILARSPNLRREVGVPSRLHVY